MALRHVAVTLKIELNLLKAFLKVESAGKHFSDNGRVVIRFEPHIFKKYAGKYKGLKAEDINHSSQAEEYKTFFKAAELDREAAFKSISMGAAQIMGFHFKRLGFDSPMAMYNAFRKSAIQGIIAFGEFIQTDKKLLKACQEKDYHIMARQYNGKKYKKYVDRKGRTYADRIKEYYLILRQK